MTTTNKMAPVSFTYNGERRYGILEEYRKETLLFKLVAPEKNAGQYRQFTIDKICHMTAM